MTKEEFVKKINEYFKESTDNYIKKEDAIYPRLCQMRIFDLPLIGFSAADDRLYVDEYKKDGVISPLYMSPKEWLPLADTVVSIFFPFTKEIRESNRCVKSFYDDKELSSSAEWLHGRIEGQRFVVILMEYAKKLLKEDGFEAIQPQIDPRWTMVKPFVSNWSERHAAYASGLGTFGLSKGLITEKGMAGRFGSIITSAHFEATKRKYSDPFEYCIKCGACEKRCPVAAIDLQRGLVYGKDHSLCSPYLDKHKMAFGENKVERYGCGKCQVLVPCEYEIPKVKE